jgi:CHAD domain-containing protein
MPKDQGHNLGAEAREPTELELRFRISPGDLQRLRAIGQLRAAPPAAGQSSRREQPAYGVLPSEIFLSRVRRGSGSATVSAEPGGGRVRYIARPVLPSAPDAEAPAHPPVAAPGPSEPAPTAAAGEDLAAASDGGGGGALELRLVSSEPKVLFDAARELVAAVPVQLASASDHGSVPERGAEAAAWRDSAAVDLAPRATVAEALATVLDRGLDDLIVNAACLGRDDHPEIVHQMRVGLRRLRSFIRICRPALAEESYALVRARLRELAAPLGPARDIDVVIEDILEPAAQRLPDEPELHRLVEAAKAARGRRYDEIRGAVAARPYTEALLDLREWTHDLVAGGHDAESGERLSTLPLGDLAARALRRQRRRVRRIGDHIHRLDAHERHEFRIAIKRLRYVAESCASVFGAGRAARYVRRLAALQKILGVENDIAVAGRVLGELASGPDGGRDPGLTFAAGMVQGFHAAGTARRKRRLLKRWKRFSATKPFWRAR